MRVISGTARGLRLTSPNGDATRPTLDNVKEAIFRMLFDKVGDAKVLDLFAGSGALGIEALSRGAALCVFSDKSKEAVRVIGENLEKSRTKDKAKVINADFLDTLSRLSLEGQRFDIIFLDPPYAKDFLGQALEKIASLSLLENGAVVVAELDDGTDFDTQNFRICKDKKYGRVRINFLEAL